MITAATVSSLRVLAIRLRSRSSLVGAVGVDQRHHAHPGLEPGQAQHQQREGEERRERRRCRGRRRPAGRRPSGPAPPAARWRATSADHHDDRVEQQEHRHQRDRDADGLLEPGQEHRAEHQQQPDGEQHLLVGEDVAARTGSRTKCAVASAEDRVIVMIHEVATNPSRVSTNNLPRQNGSSRSSIATEPCPFGLSSATRRYIGSIPNRVSSTISSVASGDTAPAARAAMPGR